VGTQGKKNPKKISVSFGFLRFVLYLCNKEIQAKLHSKKGFHRPLKEFSPPAESNSSGRCNLFQRPLKSEDPGSFSLTVRQFLPFSPGVSPNFRSVGFPIMSGACR
jgi:hypothetical protein